ncbi:DUF4114 domain-containing protein [Psychromarinibacter sp. S121]|uniref:DUF4114 domain-containing protein n=1 Tax=Psychromarinibacter sp. S121 TaxID=3415127 RepID=UPI003C7C6C5D
MAWLKLQLDFNVTSVAYGSDFPEVDNTPLAYNGEPIPHLWGLLPGQSTMTDYGWDSVLHATEIPIGPNGKPDEADFCTFDTCWIASGYSFLIYDFSIGEVISDAEFEARGTPDPAPIQVFHEVDYLGYVSHYEQPTYRWYQISVDEEDDVSVSVSYAGGGREFAFDEGGENAVVTLKVSEAVDYAIRVVPTITDPELSADLNIQNLIIPAGKTSVDIPLGFAMYGDGVEEGIESGSIEFSAEGDGEEISIEGSSTLNFKIYDEVYRQDGKHTPEMEDPYDWGDLVKGTLDAASFVDKLTRTVDPDLAKELFTKKIVKGLKLADLGVDVGEEIQEYGERLESANAEYGASDRGIQAKEKYANARYDAYIDANVNIKTKIADHFFVAGGTASGMAFVAGVAGYASTAALVAASPFLAGVVGVVIVGAAVKLAYDAVLKDKVGEIIRNETESKIPRAEFVESILENLKEEDTNPNPEFIKMEEDDPDLNTDLSNLDGDTVEGFDDGKKIVIQDKIISAENISWVSGSAIISIDADLDGESDSTFTLLGDFSDGDFMVTSNGTGSIITFETFLPDLGEGVAVEAESVNGINNQEFLTGDGERGFRVELSKALSAASYSNSLGVYEVDFEGNIVDVQLLVSDTKSNPSASIEITDVEDGNMLGFFVIQDGAELVGDLSASDTLEFIDSADGELANVGDEGSVALTLNGSKVTEAVFHSFAKALNSDGKEHALSGVVPGGDAISVGFEDLEDRGDKDFQDVVFSVSVFEIV